MVKYGIKLGLVFTGFLLTLGLRAQKKPVHKPIATKTHVEYSLDTVMQRLDDMHFTLNSINNFQNKGFDTVEVRRQLEEIISTLALIRSDMEGNALPEYKKLLLYEYMLKDIESRLESWRAALFQYNSNLVRMNAETEAFSKDSVLHSLIRDSAYREMYTVELTELRQKWDSAKKTTAINLANINALQSAITPPYFLTIDLETDVSTAKNSIASKLFFKEYPYLWEPASKGAVTGTEELAKRSLRSEGGLMQYFLNQNWGYYVYALLIGALFFFWVWKNFRKLHENPDGGTLLKELNPQYIQPIPVLATLSVLLNILPFFNLRAPTIFTQLGQFILMIVVSILFWLRWPRRYFLYWGLILFLYICYLVMGPVLVPKRDTRLWLLLLNVVFAVLTYYCIRRILHLFPYPRIIRWVWWLCFGLNILSIVCNVFGRLSLAKVFSTSSIFGLVQIIVLTVFIDSILEAFSLQIVISRLDEKKKVMAPLVEKVRKGAERWLLFLSLATWLVAFAINLNIYDFLEENVLGVWNHVVKLGSISFRVGNVLLFAFIIYVSNLLQKYIGYLYGSSEGKGAPQTGRKGSRLVMIRLVLLIAGFLLAITASGLPIDRITIVLGALGVGIGLGLQNIVNNLVSGIILIFERPFQIGDYIELNSKRGIVRDIGIRSSRLMTEEGTEIIMPNGDLLAGEVVNWTIRNSQVRIEMPITVEAGPSFDTLTKLVEESLKEHRDLAGEEKPHVLLNSSTDKTISFTVLVWVSNIGQIQTIKSQVLGLLYQTFRENGIKTV